MPSYSYAPVIEMQKGVDGKDYKVSRGTWYTLDTREEVIVALQEAQHAKTRVVLLYGDPETGEEWEDAIPHTGRISRSMGPIKAPILVHNARSIGGFIISTASLVRIASSHKDGRVFWQHPTYHRLESALEGD